MNINQEGYDRRLAVVQGILHELGLTVREPLLYILGYGAFFLQF